MGLTALVLVAELTMKTGPAVFVSWSDTRSVVINLRVGIVVMSARMVEVVTSSRLVEMEVVTSVRLVEVVMFP